MNLPDAQDSAQSTPFQYPSIARWRARRQDPNAKLGVRTWPSRVHAFFLADRGKADVLTFTRGIFPIIAVAGVGFFVASTIVTGILPAFMLFGASIACALESRVLQNIVHAADRTTPAEKERGERLLREVAREMNVEGLVPLVLGFRGFRTYLYTFGKRRPLLNAGAVRIGKHGFVLITTDIMKSMTDEQMRGVLAHELAHVRNRDSERRLVYLPVQTALNTVRRYAIFAAIVGSAALNWPVVAATTVAIPITRLIRMRKQCHREAIADRDAVIFSPHGEGLAQALEILGSQAGEKPTIRSTVAGCIRRVVVPTTVLAAKAHKAGKTPEHSTTPAALTTLPIPSRRHRIHAFLVPPHNSHPVTYDRVVAIRKLNASRARSAAELG